MKNEFENKFYLLFFSIIPISIIIGPAISFLNILIISLSVLFFILKTKDFTFLKNTSFLILILVYGYLLFNIVVSIDFNYSFLRNFGFLRFVLFFIAVNYFLFYFKKIDFVFKIWSFVIIVVLIDSYIEFIFGKNILGFGDEIYHKRIVSFFKDEPIVGGYLNGFVFILLGFFLDKFNIKNNYQKILVFILALLFLICLIMTGERSNTFKIIFGLLVFFYLNQKISLKPKIIFTGLIILSFSVLLMNSSYLKYRYGDRLFSPLMNSEQRADFIKNNKYIKHYKSGYAVFKNNLIFGVGNKNYSIETRNNQFTKKNYFPDTHPHQIYLEFLSEHGFVGTAILLISFFILIFKNFKTFIRTRNSVQLGAFTYLLTNFLPIIPSGSFFSDFNITLFCLNLSILYACNPETNIFKKKEL